jgi:hypothetical protein
MYRQQSRDRIDFRLFTKRDHGCTMTPISSTGRIAATLVAIRSRAGMALFLVT